MNEDKLREEIADYFGEGGEHIRMFDTLRDGRTSLVQELRAVLFSRGLWAGNDDPSDVIVAVARALTEQAATIDGLKEQRGGLVHTLQELRDRFKATESNARRVGFGGAADKMLRDMKNANVVLAEHPIRVIKPSVDFTKIPKVYAGQWLVIRDQECIGHGVTPELALHDAGYVGTEPSITLTRFN